jgi:hypothetical protein
VLNQQLLILDLLAAVWVLLVFLGLFGLLPLFAHPQKLLPSLSSRLAGAFVRTMTIVLIASILWVKLGLFTWFTAVLSYTLGLMWGWLYSHQWQFRTEVKRIGDKIAIATVDIFDRGLSLTQFIHWTSLPWQWLKDLLQNRFSQLKWNAPQLLIAGVGTMTIVGLTLLLRFEYPVMEFRYTHPDIYGQLLIAQQILARDIPQTDYFPVYSSLCAFVSVLSGSHPVRVTSILGAILGTILVLSVGYTIKSLTKDRASALAATYSLGVYLFTWDAGISPRLPLFVQQWLGVLQDHLNRGLIRQWAVGNLELGAIFVVLAVGFSTHLFRSKQRREALINTICCIFLVAITAPSLLVLLLFGGFGIIFGRAMALFTISTGWVMLALLAAIPNGNLSSLTGLLATLPVGLSLLMGMLFFAISNVGRLLLAKWSAAVCLTLLLSITINFFLPGNPQITYLEYDATARKTVEISRIFPQKNWTIAAPIEQLSQVYGRGWYLDLAEFVAKYHDRVSQPNFYFPIKTPLFVFAEKQPFGSEKPEVAVSYSVLSDPTYQNYRSPGGRSKLARQTIELCDRYRQNHPSSKIYYEDDRLRIYHFLPNPKRVDG